MVVQFYKISKRVNSTAIPTAESGIQRQVSLKSTSSIINPVIELRGIPDDYPDYNYMYIQKFKRFYFISDIKWDIGVWTISCSIDVLASWRGYIRNTEAHILLSTSDYNDKLVDNRIAVGADYIVTTDKHDFAGFAGFNPEITSFAAPGGYYCLTVISGEKNLALSSGATVTYFLTPGEMSSFAQELVAPDIWNSLKQFFSNPMDGIIECYYLPIDVTKYVDVSVPKNIIIGDSVFSTQGVASIRTNIGLTPKRVTIDTGIVLNIATNLEPRVTMTLYVPFCGEKPIDLRLFADSYQSFNLDYCVDIVTGDVLAVATDISGTTIIQEFSGNCKVTMPLGKEQSRAGSVLQATGGAITAIAGFSSGNVALGATGVLSAVSSIVTPAEWKSTGTQSGTVLPAILGAGNNNNLMSKIRFTKKVHNVSTWPSTLARVVGGVCNDVKFIGDLSGYCQTSQFSLDAPASKSEIDLVNSMMDSGVYLEDEARPVD